jgi:hypothetical protein
MRSKWSNRYYAALSPHVICMGIVYELWYSFCPELFLSVMGQNMESAKAALARGVIALDLIQKDGHSRDRGAK